MRWKKSIVCSCGNHILVEGNNPKYKTHTTIECSCSLCHSLVERGIYIIKNRNLERV